jgi:hypothetical protein
MRTLRTVLIALVAVLTLTAAAEATVNLWTTPLLVAAGEDFDCLLFNTSTRSITAEVIIHTFNGGIVFNSGVFALGPKQFTALGFHASNDDQATCSFTVPSKTMVRASGQTFGITNIAAPAQ